MKTQLVRIHSLSLPSLLPSLPLYLCFSLPFFLFLPEINQEHDTFFIYTDDERYPGLRSKDKYKRIIETQKDLFECYKIAHLEQLINWI